MTKINKLLTVDMSTGLSQFGWLKNFPISPKSDHIEELVDRLRAVRDIGLIPETAAQIGVLSPNRRKFRQAGFRPPRPLASGNFPVFDGWRGAIR